jgi:hypothetical protein
VRALIETHIDFIDEFSPSQFAMLNRRITASVLTAVDPMTLHVVSDRSLEICVFFAVNASVRPIKKILLVGEFYFEFKEDRQAFIEDKCPITECSLTLDSNQYRHSADAIVILNMDSVSLQ